MNKVASLFLLSTAFIPNLAMSCSVCFGTSDGNAAIALKWSMLTLFFTVSFVLVGFAFFIYYLAKRAKTYRLQTTREL